MVKVTLERLECDICGAEANRYTIAYPDGTKILDRCGKHNKKLLALKEEAGLFSPAGNHRKSGITVLTPKEIAARRNKE